MAFIAPGLRVENVPPSLGGLADRCLVSSYKVIERRIERKLSTLVRSDRAHQVSSVNRPAKNTTKRLFIFWQSRNPSNSSLQAGLAHFARINNGKNRLFLQGFCTPVPEL